MRWVPDGPVILDFMPRTIRREQIDHYVCMNMKPLECLCTSGVLGSCWCRCRH